MSRKFEIGSRVRASKTAPKWLREMARNNRPLAVKEITADISAEGLVKRSLYRLEGLSVYVRSEHLSKAR